MLLAFGPGEIVFLVGGNGSGKTTLAKLHLQHKVRVEKGAFSTQALSQGQRRW
ncbi:ATP-binding cassette domain-containing protein [Billgrantia endophytica]|uniref:ATP-binding cassette domain-containing protein n=1 Tax=Billgrantia endophytica TaxID=2033802 RepID=UPI001F0C3F94|nr:ATP-binding cassette domain-containing protein [Halomonas endophytica]